MSTNYIEHDDTSQEMISLATLPYDLLLNIARHLEPYDIHALQLVSLRATVLLFSIAICSGWADAGSVPLSSATAPNANRASQGCARVGCPMLPFEHVSRRNKQKSSPWALVELKCLPHPPRSDPYTTGYAGGGDGSAFRLCDAEQTLCHLLHS